MQITLLSLGLAGCLTLFGCHSLPPSSSPGRHALNAPFDVEARRAQIDVPRVVRVPPVPNHLLPVADILGVSYYTDDAKSVVDEALKKRNNEALAPVRDFVQAVVQQADGYITGQPADDKYAYRVQDSMYTWATAGALLGQVNKQGEYEREWSLGSLTIAYLKVRDAPGLDPAKLAVIQRWFQSLADKVVPFYERPGLKSNENNHAYWAGMAVAGVGIVCGDRSRFDWGMDKARIGINQIAADGTLPLEMERKSKALHYHVFALSPLVMLAEMGAQNGVDLYGENRKAIRRLGNVVIEGLSNPEDFARRASAPQDVTLPPVKADLAWAEAYFSRFSDERLRTWLQTAQPVVDLHLGGDMTAAFSSPLLHKVDVTAQ